VSSLKEHVEVRFTALERVLPFATDSVRDLLHEKENSLNAAIAALQHFMDARFHDVSEFNTTQNRALYAAIDANKDDTDSARKHFEAILDERRRALDAFIQSNHTRLADMNGIREQLNSQAASFSRVDTVDARFNASASDRDAMRKEMATLSTRVAAAEATAAANAQTTAAARTSATTIATVVSAVFGLIGIFVGIALHFIR